MKGNNRIHKDFNSIFYKKELTTLLGFRNKNLWALVLILFVTFVAIGFANGSLSYLAKKMSDPYVNWVNINLDQTSSENSNSIIYNCNLDSIRSKYNINGTLGYNNFWLEFSDYNDVNKIGTEAGRTIEQDDILLTRVIEQCHYGSGFVNEYDFGLIVTYELLKKHNYPNNTKYINHAFRYFGISNDTVRIIPIPIYGVVESLPGNAMFISLPFFYYNRSKINSSDNPFIVDDENSLLLGVIGSERMANNISDSILNFLKQDNYYGKFLPVNYIIESMSFDDVYNIKITFEPTPESIIVIDKVYNHLLSNKIIDEKGDIIRLYDIQSRLDLSMTYDHHAIAINFQKLGMIRKFAEYMFDNYNINIDIAQIESKENYSFISQLTKIISLILIGFSILSICLFLSNLLQNHLEKISMNIGTFKAFGLDSDTIQKIYLKIIFSVVLRAMAISILTGWLFGMSGGMRLLLKIFGSDNLEIGEEYFELYDFWTLLSILLIILISIIVLRLTVRRILRKSPGDLIYNR